MEMLIFSCFYPLFFSNLTKSKHLFLLLRTPPFSSDEDSQDSVSDLEEEPPHLRRVKSLNLMVQNKPNKPPPVLSRQSAVSQSSFSSKPQQSRQGATKTQSEDEEEWSDVSDMAEIDPRQLHDFKNQNSNNDKGSHIKG